MDDNQQSFYEQFGGDEQISMLIDDFYYRMLLDPELRDIFLKADIGKIRYHQKNYFSTLLGSNAHYKGREIISVHENLGITEYQFTKFQQHLREILLEMNKPPDIVEFIVNHVGSYKQYVIGDKIKELKDEKEKEKEKEKQNQVNNLSRNTNKQKSTKK